MDDSGTPPEDVNQDEEGNSLGWLLRKESEEVIVPMDTNVPIQR